MNDTLLRQELINFEGYKEVVYLDTKRLPTGGIGHMDRNMIPGTLLSTDQINNWYQNDVANAIAVCKKIPCWATLDEFRQRILVQLAFNMGRKLLGFTHMITALTKGDFDTAATELQASEWYSEVGRRGPISVAALRNGYYNWELK